MTLSLSSAYRVLCVCCFVFCLCMRLLCAFVIWRVVGDAYACCVKVHALRVYTMLSDRLSPVVERCEPNRLDRI